MNNIPQAVWLALIGAVGTIAGVFARRGGNRADAAAALTTAGMIMVNELQEEVGRHSKRIAVLEGEVRDCEARNGTLTAQIADLQRRVNEE